MTAKAKQPDFTAKSFADFSVAICPRFLTPGRLFTRKRSAVFSTKSGLACPHLDLTGVEIYSVAADSGHSTISRPFSQKVQNSNG
ncbi:hypothetical protein WJX74_000453 [Apatococcus lobatus]|uniref:Uncharacterized protein n=1 Tax=Apatococcus lobatus TaxID=904363 RepID=A0AAW1RA52_9CHLO